MIRLLAKDFQGFATLLVIIFSAFWILRDQIMMWLYGKTGPTLWPVFRFLLQLITFLITRSVALRILDWIESRRGGAS